MFARFRKPKQQQQQQLQQSRSSDYNNTPDLSAFDANPGSELDLIAQHSQHSHTQGQGQGQQDGNGNGGDWVALRDNATGKVYYSNTVTGASTWNIPPQLQLQQRSQSQSQQHSQGRGMNVNVNMNVNNSNTTMPMPMPVSPTSTSTAHFSNAEMANAAADMNNNPSPVKQHHVVKSKPKADNEQWDAVRDLSSGRVFYRHRTTGETRWDPPNSHSHSHSNDNKENFVNSPSPTKSVTSIISELTEMSRPPAVHTNGNGNGNGNGNSNGNGGEWKSFQDTNGRIYYRNLSTGETSWTNPNPNPTTQTSPLRSSFGSGRQSPSLGANRLPKIDEDLPHPRPRSHPPMPVPVPVPVAAVDVKNKNMNTNTNTSSSKGAGEDMNVSLDVDLSYQSSANSSITGMSMTMNPEYYHEEEEEGDIMVMPPAPAPAPMPVPVDEAVTPIRSGAGSSKEMIRPGSADSVVWEVLQDPHNGRIYYRNRMTGESVWEIPIEQQHQAQAQQSEELPLGWEALRDLNSGRSFYRNSTTGESTWEKPIGVGTGTGAGAGTGVPPALSASSSATAPMMIQRSNSTQSHMSENNGGTGTSTSTGTGTAGLPVGWEALRDPSTERVYYRNTATNEVTWNKPPTPDMNMSKEEHSNSHALTLTLPVGWEALRDTSSGKMYYRNVSTNEVSWEPPSPSLPISPSSPSLGFSQPTSVMAAGSLSGIPSPLKSPLKSPSAASGTPSAALPLPPGWAALQHQQNGRMYYANSTTGESSWDIPTAVAIDTPIAISAEVYNDDGVMVADYGNGNGNGNGNWNGNFVVGQQKDSSFYFDKQQGLWVPTNGDVNSSGNANLILPEGDVNSSGNVNISGNANRDGNGHQGDTGTGTGENETKMKVMEGAFARGHSCFWLCCDMRKAVMMTNILVMALYIFFVAVIFIGADFMGQVFDETVNLIGNEVTAEDIKAWLTAASTSKKYYEVIYGGAGILLSFVGIIGAYRFNIVRKEKCNIFFALVPLLLYLANIAGCVYLLVAVNGSDKELITLISGCVLNAVCLYPHIVFMVENMRGIMIPSTYKSVEAHWCCCTHARGKKKSKDKDKHEDKDTKKRKKKNKRSRVSPAQVQEDAGVA